MVKPLFKTLLSSENFKAGGLYLFGNIFDKAIVFLTIPIFTRILSTSDYGIFHTYLSCVSTLSLILGLSLHSSLRSAIFDFKDELEDYLSSIFFLSLLNFITTSSIIIIISLLYFDKLDLTFTWYKNKPLNYSLDNVPRTQDIEPVMIETSGFYLFKKEIFTDNGRRIGENPHIVELNNIEGIDIDTQEDFNLAKKIIK